MSSKLTSALNGLIETANDGEQGFRAAADDCSDPQLKTLFLELSAERGSFANELKALVIASGSDPAAGGSLAGVVHRGWINLKSSLSTREDLSVLEECERGEDSAVHRYQEALETDIPGEAPEDVTSDAIKTVKRQHDRILKSHHLVKSLRDKLGARSLPN